MNKDILIGTLLGDAWIEKRKNGNNTFNYSLNWQQSNKDFAIWKAEQTNLSFSNKTYKRYDKRTKKEYEITNIHITLYKKIKEELYNLFYKPKKEVSLEILDQVTDKGFSIWFMDDGNTYYNGNNCHITLSIDGFNEDSKNLIIDFLNKKYKVNFKKSAKRIRITSRKDCDKIMNIIEKYIPDCMAYKKLSNAIIKHKVNLLNKKKK